MRTAQSVGSPIPGNYNKIILSPFGRGGNHAQGYIEHGRGFIKGDGNEIVRKV